jgi:hypothetical protein
MNILNLKIVTISILIFVTIKVSGQETRKINELDYAGIKIAIPNNCEAESEYELINCNKTDIQWIYLSEETLKTMPKDFLNSFGHQSNMIKRSVFKLKSFNSELVGAKFKFKYDGKIKYRIIVFGIVNKQPLLLNIGTEINLKRNSDLNELLSKFITLQ